MMIRWQQSLTVWIESLEEFACLSCGSRVQ